MTHKAQILFLDDDKYFLEGINLKLRGMKNKWNVDYAFSVDEAVEKMLSKDYDVAISDVNMPNKNGFDFLKIVRKTPSLEDIPIVILTGNNDESQKRQALDLGATDLLNKPVSTEDLLARVKNIVKLKYLHDALKDQNSILEKEVKNRTEEIVNSRMNIIWRLAKAGEYRDEDTGKHIVRVGAYCNLLATHLSMPKDMTKLITLTSPLHDIGKIGISDTILLKPGNLTNNEFVKIQEHTVIGYKIMLDKLEGIDYLKKVMDTQETSFKYPIIDMAAKIALNHHEKWDGSGYPNGLSKEQIPIEARITAVADVYDALRSKRPYKEAFSRDVAEKIILKGAGQHFDPKIVEIFESISDKFDDIFGSMT